MTLRIGASFCSFKEVMEMKKKSFKISVMHFVISSFVSPIPFYKIFRVSFSNKIDKLNCFSIN